MVEVTCENCGMGFEILEGDVGVPCRFCGQQIASTEQPDRGLDRMTPASLIAIGLWLCLGVLYFGWIVGMGYSDAAWGWFGAFCFAFVSGGALSGIAILMFAAGYKQNRLLVTLGVLTFIVALTPPLTIVLYWLIQAP